MELHGELIRHCGMWTEKIYQDGTRFILESQSEMMSEPSRDKFDSFDEAYQELCRRT